MQRDLDIPVRAGWMPSFLSRGGGQGVKHASVQWYCQTLHCTVQLLLIID